MATLAPVTPVPPTPTWRPPRALLDSPSAPSILEQTTWPTGFYAFPDEGLRAQVLVEHFNPAVVARPRSAGSPLPTLITRRRQVHPRHYGWNTLWAHPLPPLASHTTLTHLSRGQPIHIPSTRPDEHWEDPRAVLLPNGRVLLSWCNFTRRTFAHQCHGELLPSNHVPRVHRLVHGRNGPYLGASRGHEKNWTWFVHGGQLHCSYLLAPAHTVLEVAGGKVARQHTTASITAQAAWRWGEIRGGSPPVQVGNHFYTFHHSRLPWRFVRGRWFNRYYMGTVAFEATPPFRITHVTSRPLLEGSDQDPRNEGAPLCVFPCGALMEGGEWLVVLGVNDCRCAWIRIPHADLLARMVEV